MKKINKIQKVRNHLHKHGNITSLQAFQKWNATRLSAMIHTLRHKENYIIENEKMKTKDGTIFAKYVFKGMES
jgi:hypothetical protein